MTDSDSPVAVDAAALAELVRTSPLPVLVDFYADWCGPCKFMTPVLEKFAHEHAGEVVVAKLDTDHDPDAAAEYGIRGIPTLILFLNGEEVDRQVGAVPAAYLDNMLETAAQ